MRAADDDQHAFVLTPALVMLREFWALNHAIERTSRRMATRIGVTVPQRMMLRVIGRVPGIGPGALAQLLHLDAGTVSATLRQLTARRLVTRRPHADDARRIELHLTARGSTLDAADEQTLEGALTRVLAKVDPRDQAAVRRFLAVFADELDRIAPPGRPARAGSPGRTTAR